jgi:hypothetical protein
VSRITDFYREQGTDAEGRSLQEILGWDDERLEEVHDFIQWLFPLPEPSRFSPDAPLLSPEDVAAFHAGPALQANLRRSYQRFLAFLGLAEGEDGRVQEGAAFASRIPDVWAVPNHNWLRISRVLRSLWLLGLRAESQALYTWLTETHRQHRFPIGSDTFAYWKAAAGGAA